MSEYGLDFGLVSLLELNYRSRRECREHRDGLPAARYASQIHRDSIMGPGGTEVFF